MQSCGRRPHGNARKLWRRANRKPAWHGPRRVKAEAAEGGGEARQPGGVAVRAGSSKVETMLDRQDSRFWVIAYNPTPNDVVAKLIFVESQLPFVKDKDHQIFRPNNTWLLTRVRLRLLFPNIMRTHPCKNSTCLQEA
jgi:hypothetical protein